MYRAMRSGFLLHDHGAPTGRRCGFLGPPTGNHARLFGTGPKLAQKNGPNVYGRRFLFIFYGAGERNRTSNRWFTKPLLCRLSYASPRAFSTLWASLSIGALTGVTVSVTVGYLNSRLLGQLVTSLRRNPPCTHLSLQLARSDKGYIPGQNSERLGQRTNPSKKRPDPDRQE